MFSTSVLLWALFWIGPWLSCLKADKDKWRESAVQSEFRFGRLCGKPQHCRCNRVKSITCKVLAQCREQDRQTQEAHGGNCFWQGWRETFKKSCLISYLDRRLWDVPCLNLFLFYVKNSWYNRKGGKARQASEARGPWIYHHYGLHKELQATMTT